MLFLEPMGIDKSFTLSSKIFSLGSKKLSISLRTMVPEYVIEISFSCRERSRKFIHCKLFFGIGAKEIRSLIFDLKDRYSSLPRSTLSIELYSNLISLYIFNEGSSLVRELISA